MVEPIPPADTALIRNTEGEMLQTGKYSRCFPALYPWRYFYRRKPYGEILAENGDRSKCSYYQRNAIRSREIKINFLRNSNGRDVRADLPNS